MTYYGSVTAPANGTFILNGDDTIYAVTDSTYLRMQGDGNLVLRDKDGTPLWSSQTSGYIGDYTLINSNGNIEVKSSTHQIVWQSGTIDTTTSSHSLHVSTNCAYLLNQYNTLLWNRGTGCCAIYDTYLPDLETTTPTQVTEAHILINNQSLPIDDISWINDCQIAWIKVVSCTEAPDAFTYYYDKTYIFDDLAPSVISVKIEPFCSTLNPYYEDFTVIAIPYSNPVYALRNNREMSYLYDPNTDTISGTAPDTTNWIGSDTAINRLSGNCIGNGALHTASNRLFHACGNQDGLLIIFDHKCDWNYHDMVGQDMEVYFGFELVNCDPTEYPSVSISNTATTQDLSTKSAIEESHTIFPSVNPSQTPIKSNIATTSAIEDSDAIFPSQTPMKLSTNDPTVTTPSKTKAVTTQYSSNVLVIVKAVLFVAVGVMIIVTSVLFIIYRNSRPEAILKRIRMQINANETININGGVQMVKVRDELLNPNPVNIAGCIGEEQVNILPTIEGDHENNPQIEEKDIFEDMYDDKLKVKEVITPTANFDTDEVNKMTLETWLNEVVKLPQYYELFVNNGYESIVFIMNIKDDSELDDIGINAIGHKIRIMIEIEKLKKTKGNDVLNIEKESITNDKKGVMAKRMPEHSKNAEEDEDNISVKEEPDAVTVQDEGGQRKGDNLDIVATVHDENEDVILDEMLSDVMEMQKLDANKIHEMKGGEGTDSDNSDNIYDKN